MADFANNLDLSQLLLFHAGLNSFLGLFTSPSYNLPISLFGLVCVVKYNQGQPAESNGLRYFVGLHALSFILDIFWLISWGGDVRVFAIILILINLAAKVVTLLATVTSLRQHGEVAFPANLGFSSGPSTTIWSMPGEYQSAPQHETPYQGFGDEEAQPQVPPKSNTPSRPSNTGGYHSIGDDS